jgi:hypothetical protein
MINNRAWADAYHQRSLSYRKKKYSGKPDNNLKLLEKYDMPPSYSTDML